MSVSVAEYLGQRTDIDMPVINPVLPRGGAMCPFMDRTCDKVNKNLPPVCSVRKNDNNNTLWIVCEHRLCATVAKDTNKAPIGLVPHQVDILRKVASNIYRVPPKENELAIRREVKVPLGVGNKCYKADFIMRNLSITSKIDEILLEMQGGGETSNTGKISKHLNNVWGQNPQRDNKLLRAIVSASPLETNAWRRQQEQFLVKGNVVAQTGGKLVFVIGTLLYDYLYERIEQAGLIDLERHNWTLCLMGVSEDMTNAPMAGPVPLVIDPERKLYTNYSSFVRYLTDQGGPCPEMFTGEGFLTVDGNHVSLLD